MSNICHTTYKIVSDLPEELMVLYETIKKLENRKKPLVKNNWDNPNLWLGCLVRKLKGDCDKIYCRGYISYYDILPEVLTIETLTAWREMHEVRHFIESRFPRIKIYYMQEEPGVEIFSTNDSEGIFFKERYYLNGYGHSDSECFDSLEKAAEYIKNIVGHEVEADFASIKEALNKYAEEHDDKDDYWYGFYEIEVTDS